MVAGTPKPFRVERNHSLPPACFCPCGRLWDLLFAVLMNCSSLEPWVGATLTLAASDVFMDSANREVSIDLIVRLWLHRTSSCAKSTYRLARQGHLLVDNSSS